MDDRSPRRGSSQGARRDDRGPARVTAPRGASDESIFESRLLWLFSLLALVAVIIGGRLLWLQVIGAQGILDSGTPRDVTVDSEPRRGTIYDRNGTILATTVDVYNVFCHPNQVPDDKVDQLAQALVSAFGGKVEDYRAKITQDTTFVYLYKGADEAGMTKIKDLSIDGVDFEETTKRIYPCGSTASQVIGMLDSDGNALTGLELYYDDILSGTPGHKTTEYSKTGVPVPGSEHVTAEVVDGKDIVVSIDVDMQQKLEESLAVRVEEVDGKGGSAILMDSTTGEIYACSSAPTFDVSNPTKIEEGATNLSGISSAFEPGSVMKPVTMLAALENGTVDLNSSYYCPSVLKVDEYEISDSHDRAAQDMDVSTIMAESSNVGMSLIAKDLSLQRLSEAIARYHLTDVTGVDYPGEAAGTISDYSSWSTVQGYNIAFGQGLTTTPLEMTRFYAALANNGTETTPHFLLSVPAEGGERSYETQQITDNQEAIDDLETMMEAVVDRGTGTDAQIKGHRVVGKTGTAEIASDTGGYKKGVYNLSFIGYLPDSSTNLVCFVGATDVPGERKTVSAFRDIMAFAIDRYNITQE